MLVSRLARRRDHIPTHGIEKLKALQLAAERSVDTADLLGIEGYAARVYFAVYRESLIGGWEFPRRTRRPPKDPVNALLSLGYTFLGHAAMAALEIVGLDPYLGFFHAEKYGRPALALDLVEEFRAPIVDSLVLDILNHRLLDNDDFEPGPKSEAIYLTPKGLRVFLTKFSQRLESQITPREIGRPLSYRKLIEVQARKLANVIIGKENRYKTFQAR